MNFATIFIILNIFPSKLVYGISKLRLDNDTDKHKELSDHTMVIDSDVFPYVVAILKKSSYISAGALIGDNWVVTAADSLFLLRESLRLIRIRLGSTNYRKGGIVLPIKSLDVHPYFDDKKPEFDIALIMLPERVGLSYSLNPIRVQKYYKGVMATHFIVTAWSNAVESKEQQIESMEAIKRRRLLTVSHLHPSTTDSCSRQLSALGINQTETIMCLDPTLDSDPCMRDVGGPVVLNGILYGVISSWKPDNCDEQPGSIFVTLAAAANISSWIHATTRGHRWSQQADDH